MAEQDDIHIGRTLLASGRITPEELLQCLFDLAEDRRSKVAVSRPLGVLLVSRGRVTRKEIDVLLAQRVPTPDEQRLEEASGLALGELLAAAGAATPDQIQECLLQQENDAPGRRLGELLIDRGYCTAAQIQRALQYHDKTIYVCRGCAKQFNLIGAVPGHEYCCEDCGGGLNVASSGSVSATETSSHLPAQPTVTPVAPASTVAQGPALPPDAQAHIDRAVYVYVKQKLAVRRDTLKEAVRFQIELSQYNLWVPIADILSRFGGLTWLQADQIRKTDFKKIVESQAWKQQQVPGYRIVARIASGGFATIFSADPIFGGPRAAIKVLHADSASDPAAVTRFRNEAALLARLHHPGLVRAVDFSEHRQLYCLTMELVDGDSLDRLVCEGRGMNVVRALDVTRQIAEALSYVLGAGYLHRDVKAENILVTRDGQAKLCDLGFAAEVGTGNPSMDMYALGETLFFMLTAHTRYAGRTSGELLTERMAMSMGEPDFTLVRAPEGVVELARRMLHPRREMRFETYAELLKAIAECRP